MRTIKFRAKNLDGEWCYGFYVEEERQTINGFKMKHFIVNDGYRYVNPDTVGQFTGLYDKDGKEIYEGDIIMSDRDREAVYHELYYNEDEASFYAALNGKKDSFFGDCHIRRDWIQRFEKRVIGNVHDNPELLTNE